jgi:hypothetical protein
VIYTVRGEELLETVSPCSGYLQQGVGSRSGSLELGDHPVADMLRALEPSQIPVVTRSYLNLRLMIPPRVSWAPPGRTPGTREASRSTGRTRSASPTAP